MDHIKKYSRIKNKWILPLVPLATLTARLIQTISVSLFDLGATDPVLSIIFRVYTSLFWFAAIAVILVKLKLSPKIFMGAPPQSRMWLLPLISVPLYIAATFLIPFYSDILQRFLPTLAGYIDSKQFAPVVYNLSNTTHTVIINSIMGLFLIIIIPIYEEALFRGIILVRWIHKYGVGRSILLTSILWGFLHYRSFLQSVTFSLVLSGLYVKTKGLYVPMLCHILYNGIVFWLIIR